MGLFDGKGGGGELASTAHVAKLLDAPVVLVVDARAMARSAAAMVHGYTTFDPELRVAGVVLNRVGSATHERMLREALDPLGYPGPRRPPPRRRHQHPGPAPRPRPRRRTPRRGPQSPSTPSAPRSPAPCDLDAVLRLARSAGTAPRRALEPGGARRRSGRHGGAGRGREPARPSASSTRRTWSSWRAPGPRWSSSTPPPTRTCPKATDALYLGGGFPETYAEALSANEPYEEKVRAFALERPSRRRRVRRPPVPLPASWTARPMCGVLDATARMTDRLTLGYREARALADSPLARQGRIPCAATSSTTRPSKPGAGETPAWELAGRGPEGFVLGRRPRELPAHPLGRDPGAATRPAAPERPRRTRGHRGARA